MKKIVAIPELNHFFVCWKNGDGVVLSNMVTYDFVARESGALTSVFGKYGDVDNSGEVDAKDLATFKTALLANADCGEAFDTDGNGKVDLLDFIRLKKYLSDNKVPLGKNNSLPESKLVSEIANLPNNKQIA